MIGFRDKGIFYEAATNQILDDLVAVCQPRRMTVVGAFSVRGGMSTSVTATYTETVRLKPDTTSARVPWTIPLFVCRLRGRWTCTRSGPGT